jgi:hypothetical protein
MAPPVVTLPQVVIAEFSPFRRWTASGLFSYRQAQAIQLIQLPDLGPGDLSPDERREALNQMVSLHRPLAAIAIAMGVVALEDFIRDICARLAGTQFLHLHFPRIRGLETVLLSPNQNRPFARLDKDPIVGFTEPGGTNDLFVKCIGLGPFEPVDFDRLRDLALIRHTVVHHAAVIRGIDAPRFQYYIVQAEQLINPPPTFVNETLLYLHQLGLKFEKAIAAHIFSRVLPTLGPGWAKRRPQDTSVRLSVAGKLVGHFTTGISNQYSLVAI